MPAVAEAAAKVNVVVYLGDWLLDPQRHSQGASMTTDMCLRLLTPWQRHGAPPPTSGVGEVLCRIVSTTAATSAVPATGEGIAMGDPPIHTHVAAVS